MGKTLQRILRIRQLAEEQSRLEVERAAQRARRAAAACARQVTLEQEQRAILATSWIPDQEGDPGSIGGSVSHANVGEVSEEKGWLMEEAVLEFFGWRRMRLEELRQAELRRMEPLIEAYTKSRRELRQAEQLIEQQVKIESIEQNRRAQADSDEWFAQRALMHRRRDLRRTGTGSPQDLEREARQEANEDLPRQF